MNIEVSFTNDPDLLEYEVYKKIEKLLNSFLKSGMLSKFAGNCVSASEIVQGMLLGAGIESKIHEVDLFITVTKEKGIDWTAVGYNSNLQVPNTVDTHVVVITNTKIPILIDLSIAHLMPNTHPFVVEKVNCLDPDIVSIYNIENYHLRYGVKKFIRLPSIHQKTILEKIRDEEKLQKNVKIMFYVLVFLIVMTIINFGANSALIYLKLVYP